MGNSQDPCCQSIYRALEERNYPTRIVANPLAQPPRFAWRLNNEQSASQLVWDEEPPLLDDHISGVFVRHTAWLDPTGWQPDDLAYMHAETQAALLAWLWSLPCPVVNRYSPAIWYGPKVSLLCWQHLLRRCGFPTLETLVTNDEEEARAFGRRLAQQGVAGAVYGPLTSEARYLIIDDKDWNGLAAMQRCAPVCLTYPHGAPQFVCLAGERVVWEGGTPPEATLLEPAIRRFALATGLAFVAFAFAEAPQGPCVIAVESHPYFERFGDAARQQIVEGLVEVLTADVDSRRNGAEQSLQGSLI